MLVRGELRGNLVTNAQLAALAVENGVGICSFDSDFAGLTGSPGTVRPANDSQRGYLPNPAVRPLSNCRRPSREGSVGQQIRGDSRSRVGRHPRW